MRMLTGHALHEMWQKIMVDVFGDDFCGIEEEVSAEIDGIKIPGHPDGRIDSLGCVWEFKSCSDSTFKMLSLQGHPLPSHIEQGNIYAHALGLKNVVFHYFNKNTAESLWFLVPYSETLAIASAKKFKGVDGSIPDRPYNDPTGSPCWFCQHKDKCYEGYRAEVDSGGIGYLNRESEPVVYSAANVWWSMRSKRLSMEKAEDTAKGAAIAEVLNRKLKTCIINEYVIEVKLGKNDNPLASIKKVEGDL